MNIFEQIVLESLLLSEESKGAVKVINDTGASGNKVFVNAGMRKSKDYYILKPSKIPKLKTEARRLAYQLIDAVRDAINAEPEKFEITNSELKELKTFFNLMISNFEQGSWKPLSNKIKPGTEGMRVYSSIINKISEPITAIALLSNMINGIEVNEDIKIPASSIHKVSDLIIMEDGKAKSISIKSGSGSKSSARDIFKFLLSSPDLEDELINEFVADLKPGIDISAVDRQFDLGVKLLQSQFESEFLQIPEYRKYSSYIQRMDEIEEGDPKTKVEADLLRDLYDRSPLNEPETKYLINDTDVLKTYANRILDNLARYLEARHQAKLKDWVDFIEVTLLNTPFKDGKPGFKIKDKHSNIKIKLTPSKANLLVYRNKSTDADGNKIKSGGSIGLHFQIQGG